MCVFGQVPDEAADSLDLSQKVSVTAPAETERAPAADETAESEEEKALPEWSEKVASGILTGEPNVWGLNMRIYVIVVGEINLQSRKYINLVKATDFDHTGLPRLCTLMMSSSFA